jgi:hypothetical protein
VIGLSSSYEIIGCWAHALRSGPVDLYRKVTAGTGRKAMVGREMVVKDLGVIRAAVAVARIASRVLDALNAIVFVYVYLCG